MGIPKYEPNPVTRESSYFWLTRSLVPGEVMNKFEEEWAKEP